MKALSTIALASLFLIPAAYADHHGGKMGKGADMMGKGPGMMMDCPLDKPAMQADLGLSAEQKKKIDSIHEEAMKKHKALRDETHSKVLKVLTPEQAKKLEAHRAEKMENHAEKMEKRAEHMEKRADRMKERADKMQKQADQMKTQATQPAPAQ